MRGWSCAGCVRWRLEWVVSAVLESFVLREDKDRERTTPTSADILPHSTQRICQKFPPYPLSKFDPDDL